mgnify:CR=1 FL=1
MKIIKRNGTSEHVQFDQITERIRSQCSGLSDIIDPSLVSQKVCSRVHDGITSSELDELSAEVCIHMTKHHYDYSRLASRITVNNHQKNTSHYFSDVMLNYKGTDFLDEEFMQNVEKYKDQLDDMIVSERDYLIDYFGFKTLFKSYLFRVGDKIIERPQHLWLRVALCIHGNDLEQVQKCYNHMSNKHFTHATPTLFHAGLKYPQLSSCFLMGTDDSVDGIFSTMADVARISKWAGGIGIHCGNVRARGSHIRKTNGRSDGIMPMLKVYNEICKYINQSSRRNGSFAFYMPTWHADIFEFLDAGKNHGAEEVRARDLFYGLWISDLFMNAVYEDQDWYLMCPDQCPGLYDSYGEQFEKLYKENVDKGNYKKKIKAKELWSAIIDCQIETGQPYFLYADACNKKSNQKNLGTIKSSNLCTEIIEYSDKDEYAVCNLASISLSSCVKDGVFNFEKLQEITRQLVVNLNMIIDKNFYPVPQTKKSNMKHRPVGIGVQGLADAYILMGYNFESEQARELNKLIFENIYYAAVDKSSDMAEKYGVYESYEGSPMSQGQFQFDMWSEVELTAGLDWEALREKVARTGLRNSLLTTVMPTASTSQILGNNECIEPFTSNMYTRRVLAGEFTVINKHLVQDLQNLGLWNEDMVEKIMYFRGSVQKIMEIPQEIRSKYKIAWEIKQKEILTQAADRGPFICQSQSMNMFVAAPSYQILSTIHFAGWKKGLKTGSYYIRTKPAVNSQSFTIDPEKVKKYEQECELCSA